MGESKPPGDRRDERITATDEPVVFHVPGELLVEVPVEAEQQVPRVLVLLLHGVVESDLFAPDGDTVGPRNLQLRLEIVASREQGKVAQFSEHKIASEARRDRDNGAAVHQRWAEV